MIYASLNDLYDDKLQSRTNNYDDIIKNLIISQELNKEKTIPDPILSEGSKYTKYKPVNDFTNKYNNIKEIEKKVENFENVEKKDTLDFKNNSKNIECMEFLDHISKCEKCREFIMKKMNLRPINKEDKMRQDMLDIAIYVLSGIFILFLLDSFMGFGKMLKK